MDASLVFAYVPDSEIAKLGVDKLWMYKLAEVYPKASKAYYDTYKESYYEARRQDISEKLLKFEKMQHMLFSDPLFEEYDNNREGFMRNIGSTDVILSIGFGYDDIVAKPNKWRSTVLDKLGIANEDVFKYTKDDMIAIATRLYMEYWDAQNDIFVYDNGVYFSNRSVRCLFKCGEMDVDHKPDENHIYVTYYDLYVFCKYHQLGEGDLYFDKLEQFPNDWWTDDGYVILNLSLKIVR